jgi:hypothetical protein
VVWAARCDTQSALSIRIISPYLELKKKATEMPDNRLTSSRKAATFGDEVILGEGGRDPSGGWR